VTKADEVVLLASDRPFVERGCPHATDGSPPVRRIRTPAGDPAWLVTGAEEIRSVLVDDRVGRSHPDPGTMPKYAGDPLYDMVINADHRTADVLHQRLRKLIRPHFTARRMLQLRPRIAAVVAESLDHLASAQPPTDLHAAFAEPVVLEVICELLGIPRADRERCAALISRVQERGVEQTGAPAPDSLLGYLLDLVPRKRATPEVDVISGLCQSGVSDDEAAQLSLFLLFAGFGSTVKQIAYGFLLLANNPGQRQLLIRDPALIPFAVEEMLRVAGSLSLPRYARKDFTFHGARIAQGDLVLLDLSLANLDERDAPEPGRFNVARRANRHLSFSYGGWTCLGAPLARVILQEVFAGALTRLPSLAPAVPVHQLPPTDEPLGGGLGDELLVTW
jgi:cytochrome P450